MEILEINIQTIAQALSAVGATSATVEYSGSGDSGDSIDFSLDWPGEPGQQPGEVTHQVTSLVKEEGTVRYLLVAVERTSDFKSAIEDVLWQAISSAGHEGWENQEGGGGSFTVFANGHATLEHYDNVVETIYDNHTFGKPQDDAGSEKSA
jgi:hypothetical protein